MAAATEKSSSSSSSLPSSFEKRVEEARKLREKFPGRIPVLIDKAPRSDVPDLDKKKYIVPGDLSLGQFIYVIRKRLALPPEQALFIFVGNTLATSSSLMREIHATYADADGFLRCTYSGESSFGGCAEAAGADAAAPTAAAAAAPEATAASVPALA